MKRKVIIENCTLYLGDCEKIIPILEDICAVVTDPPYGIKENYKKSRSRENLAKSGKYGEFDWDKKPATKTQIEMMRNISKYQIIFGGNYFDLPPTSCWLIWDKENGKSDFADCEIAWSNLKKAIRLIRWQWHGMIRKGEMDKTKNPITRKHPTQKPVGVMKWCIDQLPKDTSTILDPFMGSGTTLVACAEMGKKGIGIEINQEYFDVACERVKEACRQKDLFL